MKLLRFIAVFLLLIILCPAAFAQENTDSTLSKQIDSNTAREIITRYIDAIGGKEALSSIEDRTTIMRGNIMGQNVTLVVKQKWPNKLRQEIKSGDMSQLTVFDGEKGVMKAAGQVIEISGKELDALKIESTMDVLFDPESFGIKLSYDGESVVDEKTVQKIIMTLPSGLRWFQFYDKESGLKTQENKEMQTQMGLMEISTYYSDYKDVDGKLYPFKIKQSVGPQSFELNVSSIKLNTGMDDSIFELEEEPAKEDNTGLE